MDGVHSLIKLVRHKVIYEILVWRSGDLFLFYGWFRRVELEADHLVYVVDAPDLHVNLICT